MFPRPAAQSETVYVFANWDVEEFVARCFPHNKKPIVFSNRLASQADFAPYALSYQMTFAPS
jgi:hypothetical protein